MMFNHLTSKHLSMSTSLWDYFYRLQKRAIHAKAQHDRVRTKLLMCLLIVFAQLVCICSYLTHIFVCHRMSSYKAQDAPIKLVLQKNLKRLRIPDMEIHVPGEEVEQLNAQQRYCRLHQINQARSSSTESDRPVYEPATVDADVWYGRQFLEHEAIELVHRLLRYYTTHIWSCLQTFGNNLRIHRVTMKDFSTFNPQETEEKFRLCGEWLAEVFEE